MYVLILIGIIHKNTTRNLDLLDRKAMHVFICMLLCICVCTITTMHLRLVDRKAMNVFVYMCRCVCMFMSDMHQAFHGLCLCICVDALCVDACVYSSVICIKHSKGFCRQRE